MPELSRGEFLSLLAGGAVGAMTGGLLSGGQAAAGPAELEPLTVLTGATVIDGTGAAPLPDTTVVLGADRILAVGRYPDIALPPQVRVLDLAGKFIIPGLWDMHTHFAEAEATFPPLHVVHGVTGIREMWGFPQTHDLRRRVDQGQLLGPRMVIGSNIIDGPPGIWPGSAVVSDEQQARAAVRQAQREGADFVKVYSLLAPESLRAIADEAGRAGLPFAGHVPNRVPVADAVELGQHTLEHMYGMLIATSSRAPELYAEIEAADPSTWHEQQTRHEREAAQSYDPQRATGLMTRMIQRNIWLSPTLVVLQRLTAGEAPGTPDDERLRYLPDYVREYFVASIAKSTSAAAEVPGLRQNFQAKLDLIGTMNAAGVGIVAGTDAGNPFVFPGFSLHEELELLVQAGLSPLQALQAATRNAARCLGLEHLTGTVEVGKQADLVVLDADPLASIGNTQRIHAVVSRGRYLAPEDRERILREVELVAQAPTPAMPITGGLGRCCG